MRHFVHSIGTFLSAVSMFIIKSIPRAYLEHITSTHIRSCVHTDDIAAAALQQPTLSVTAKFVRAPEKRCPSPAGFHVCGDFCKM